MKRKEESTGQRYSKEREGEEREECWNSEEKIQCFCGRGRGERGMSVTKCEKKRGE